MSFMYLALLGGCGGPEAGPEEQVRQWVSAGQQAAETKERGDLLDLISPSYIDSRGFDRDDIGDRLRVYFLRQQSIKLLTSIEEIRLIWRLGGGSRSDRRNGRKERQHFRL